MVWQKAHQLVLKVYRSTKEFPKEELYGITSQMRRAGVSIPNNIAEGCGRCSEAEVGSFLQIAMGSASELEYLLLLSRDLQLLASSTHDDLNADVTEVKRMLSP